MTNSNPERTVEEQISAMETRLERLETDSRETASLFIDGLRALSEQTTNLANGIDRLTQRVDALTTNQQSLQATVSQLATFMVQIARTSTDNQTEIRRIWEYLLRQSGNGNQP